MQTPDTTAQKEAREEYTKACIALSEASHTLYAAQAIYKAAFQRYEQAFGAARQAGVLR